MSSAQDLRKRIKSVKNTQQITKAMKMVASARLRRAQTKAKSTEPYAEKLGAIMSNVASGIAGNSLSRYPLMAERTVNRTGYLLIGADKGLAGAYTSNLIKFFKQEVSDMNREALTTVTVGRKPYEHMKHQGFHISSSYSEFSDKPEYTHAQAIVADVTERFLKGDVDRVVMIYTHFVNSLTQTVKAVQLLPATPPESEQTKSSALYDFDPSEADIFGELLPKYLEITVYNALLQAAASELGARMTAMTSATDNAGELISTLNLEYNKLRQAGITNELNEIVGGANALQ